MFRRQAYVLIDAVGIAAIACSSLSLKRSNSIHSETVSSTAVWNAVPYAFLTFFVTCSNFSLRYANFCEDIQGTTDLFNYHKIMYKCLLEYIVS